MRRTDRQTEPVRRANGRHGVISAAAPCPALVSTSPSTSLCTKFATFVPLPCKVAACSKTAPATAVPRDAETAFRAIDLEIEKAEDLRRAA